MNKKSSDKPCDCGSHEAHCCGKCGCVYDGNEHCPTVKGRDTTNAGTRGCPTCAKPAAPPEPEPFDLAINRLLDVIEGTDLDDDFDLHELRGAAHDAESAMIDFACTPAYVDWPLREARLVGALCRLAGDMTSKPAIVRSIPTSRKSG